MARRGHLPALDGLRGVAILLVFSVHCFDWPKGGHLGVDLFFMLSGFLITTLLLEERDATGRINLRVFYARRARRLLPALALLLTAYLAIDAAKGHNGLKAAAFGGLYVANLVEAFGQNPGVLSGSGLDHLWSLAQEEQFYLLWPLLVPVVALVRRPVRLLAIVIGFLVLYRIALAVNGASHHRLYNGPDTHADGLLAGAAVAFLLARSPQFIVSKLLPVAALPIAVDALLLRDPSPAWDAFGLPIAEAACVAILVAALTLPGWAAVLSWSPLRWLGRISYSLYLWHFMLIWAFNGQHRLIPAGLSIVVAYVSTRWIEEPIRRRRAPSAGLAPAVPATA
ncbi:MAG: acyltransferase family protein [Gaiellaceae bacterium]